MNFRENFDKLEKYINVLSDLTKLENSKFILSEINDLYLSVKTELDNIKTLHEKRKDPNGKSFDIIHSDGRIEVGLYANTKEDLLKLFQMTSDNISIIREIDEYGTIIKQNDISKLLRELPNGISTSVPLMGTEVQSSCVKCENINEQIKLWANEIGNTTVSGKAIEPVKPSITVSEKTVVKNDKQIVVEAKSDSSGNTITVKTDEKKTKQKKSNKNKK